MTGRKRILFVIGTDLYVRNYVESGVLDKLAETHDLYFAARTSLKLTDRIRARYSNVSQYTLTPLGQRKGQLVFDVMMLRYATRSKSFEFRARSIPPPFWASVKAKRSGRQIVTETVNRALAASLSSGPAYDLFKRHFVDKLRPNETLTAIVDDVRPDLVMIPSAGYSIDVIDLVKICRPRGIRTLLLIDNWDNLSSKSVLWELPDHVGVWGKQSKEHAIDIQGFKPNQVSLIGTPRFDSYLGARVAALPSHFPFPYALFVGTSLPFDEAGALQQLDRELDQNPEIYGGLRIVYRPHPWRWGKDHIGELGLNHVVIDPQMEANYARRKIVHSFQPSLDYYPSLLKNAVFALGGISSMLIESVAFAKRYVVIVYDEEGNMFSPKRVYEDHVHFRGLERVPGLRFCGERSALGSSFRKVFNDAKSPLPFEDVDREREYFLRMDELPYSERLREVVGNVLSTSAAE